MISLVIADAVTIHQFDKMPLVIARQRGFAEMGILRKKGGRLDIVVGEVAASTAGDQEFLAGFMRMIQNQNPAPATSGRSGTHQSGRTGSDDNDIPLIHINHHV